MTARSRIRWRSPVTGLSLALAIVALALVRPARPAPFADVGPSTAFRWDAAGLFAALEDGFLRARQTPFEVAREQADALDRRALPLLEGIGQSEGVPLDDLTLLAEQQFAYALIGAAHPSLLPRAEGFVLRARVTVMRAAAGWPALRETHEALYRVLFGGRMAIEEALVQAGSDALPALVQIEEIASATPFIDVEGVRVHSGDILLSRGGAPTSALIARGGDFANTFSHAALVHVDADTGVGTVIESLIETGSMLSTVEAYLESKARRILVLRIRPDHPALATDSLLPHRAASLMLERLQADPVPYDFSMQWADAAAMFCSEVVYHAFGQQGLELWSIRSAMSAPGLVRWLGAMGVREFRTIVPSDLEYDAQLRAVAEWRDVGALMDYRLDNAITDALLEQADRGLELGYSWFALPAARLVKGLSVGQALLGMQPTIPVGMPADAALRIAALVTVVSPMLKQALAEREARFLEENGYRAPYWTLVDIARAVLLDLEADLAPALRQDGPWRTPPLSQDTTVRVPPGRSDLPS